MGSFSLAHWIIVALVVLVLFGRGKISETMGDFGKGMKSFRQGLSEDDAPRPPPADPAAITASKFATSASGFSRFANIAAVNPAAPAPTTAITGLEVTHWRPRSLRLFRNFRNTETRSCTESVFRNRRVPSLSSVPPC